MLLTYIFYFISIISIVVIVSDIGSWGTRTKIAKELFSPEQTFDIGKDWSNLKPVLQRHILFALYHKYFLFGYFLIGLMTSQWIVFLGLIGFRLIIFPLHNQIAKKIGGTFFSDIIIPIFYRLIVIAALATIIINRFHYKIF